MTTPDEKVITAYNERLADHDSDHAATIADVAASLGLSEDHVDSVVVEWWFMTGGG